MTSVYFICELHRFDFPNNGFQYGHGMEPVYSFDTIVRNIKTHADAKDIVRKLTWNSQDFQEILEKSKPWNNKWFLEDFCFDDDDYLHLRRFFICK